MSCKERFLLILSFINKNYLNKYKSKISMENDQKLKAPKAVFGLKKKSSSNSVRSTEETTRSSLFIRVPQKSGSFNQLPWKKMSNTTKEKSRFALEKDIEKDFDELSVKQEIFSILRNESATWCETPDIRSSDNCNREAKINLDFFENDSEAEDDSIRDSFLQSPMRSKNPLTNNENILVEMVNGFDDNLCLYSVNNTATK
jgi:hypothetical protein